MLELRTEGLYCPVGDFFIDPWRPVPFALITHAHSDHARSGHGKYLCHPITRSILQVRLGDHTYETIQWGEQIVHKGVRISLHPAGHVAGSSQIRIEYKGEVWVVSGDYKLENDGISGAFEPIKCHTFITESTFGLPVYQWEKQNTIYRQLQEWVLTNNRDGMHSVFFAYSLGKAQRVADALSGLELPIHLHHSVKPIHETLRTSGIDLPLSTEFLKNEEVKSPGIVIAPLSVIDTPWIRRFRNYRSAICSGWMQIRGQARRQDVDTGFVMSDHADWNGLNTAIRETGAEKVLVTHGFRSVLSRYLREQGTEAHELEADFLGETGAEEEVEPTGEKKGPIEKDETIKDRK